MTYLELVNRIQSIVNKHFQLVDFGYGDLSDLKTRFENTSGDSAVQADYPYLFLNPGVHTRNLTTMTYNFNMIVMDMARGEVDDAVYLNQLAIQSQCQQMIDDVLANLYYGFKDQPEVMRTNISYTPFNERFQDDVAGMTASLSIEVPAGLNNCIAPFGPTFNEILSVTNTIEYTLGPDFGEDNAFTYNTEIFDPENDWNINRFQSLVPGQYEFVVDQEITLNQPALGEVIPQKPIIYQTVEGQQPVNILPVTETGWPTEFESTDKVYRYRATYRTTVPEIGPAYVWQFMILKDEAEPESTLQQKQGGSLKIGRAE